MSERLLISKEEAVELLEVNGDDSVHTQYNSVPGMFIGADRSLESVKETIEGAFEIEIGGPNCIAMGHGICVWETEKDNRPLFVAHNDEKLKAKFPEAYEN